MKTTNSLLGIGGDSPETSSGETSFFYIGGCGGSSPASVQRISPTSAVNEIPQEEHHFRNQYGTHTTALGILLPDGTGIFIDQGSGAVRVAEFFRIKHAKSAVGLMTHFHADHRTGVQNNPLLFRKGFVSTIHAPALPGPSFRELLERDFSPETWPISPTMLGIEHKIEEFVPGATINVGQGVQTLLLNHPGKAAAFRINLPRGAVVIATDDELTDPKHCAHYAEFVSGAKVLYVDMQYRDSEYAGEKGIGGGPAMSRVGWGHSTPDMLERTLLQCKVAPEIILIGHHDPNRPDADLNAFEGEMIQKFSISFPHTQVRFAHEADLVRV